MLGKILDWLIGENIEGDEVKLPYDYILNLYRFMQIDNPMLKKPDLEYIFSQAEIKFGQLTELHIFVPPGLNLFRIFFALNHYNEFIVRLALEFGDEVWQRGDCLLTPQPGFMVVKPEIDGFSMTYQEQIEYLSRENRSLITAELISWLFVVWAEKFKESYPFNDHSVRCLNCCERDTELCLIASNKPERGYLVSPWYKDQGHPNLGIIHYDFVPLNQII